MHVYKYVVGLVLCAYLCALGGCALNNEKYKQVCNSWLNHDVNELIRNWGPPTKTYDMPNGNKVYTWSRAASETTPVMTLPSTTTYNRIGNTVYQNNPAALTIGGDVVTYYCNTSFEVNSAGIIVYWTFQGNSCR